MSNSIVIDKHIPEEEIYLAVLPQIFSLIVTDAPIISCLSNVTSALKNAFDKISWVGFYLKKENYLYLGPFQGNVACTKIQIGKGVCGTSALNKETIIVDNVDAFPGHIACDSKSKSEIVVPLIKSGNVLGVIDLDSYDYSSFNETDKLFLEQLCKKLTEIIDETILQNILK